TYYWRVDEVNGTPDKTVFKGDVWRFTAEPYSIEIPGATVAVTASSASNEFSTPEKTIDGSGLDPNTGAHSINPETMWFTASVDLDPWIQYEFDDVQKLDMMKVWNSNGSAESAIGWGVKDVVIQYSVDGEAWNALEPTQFGRAPGLPTYNQYDEITLDGLAAKYVRLDIQSNWGGILMSYGLSEVKFFMIPAQARTPQPASGAADILPDSILTWRAGREAAQHTVYISSDMNAVAEGSASSVTSMTNNVELSSLSLELGETYYWRVDEVNQAEAVSMWAGPVWSFSTVAALTVDDFESYNNFSPDRPFQTWLDGFGYSSDEFFPVGYPGNATGAGIGHDIWSLSSPHYDGDIMETSSTIAGSGQSMPFYYTNSGGVASQTERTFVIAQDWTVGGAKTLAIAFRGQAGNTGTLYAKINNTKVTYPHDAGDMVRGTWQAWNIDLSSMDVQNVTKLVFGVEGSGASGMILFDDIELYPLVPSDGVSGLVAYWPFDTDFTNVEGTADYDGTPSGTAEISADDVKVGAGALKIDDNTSSANHVVVTGNFVGGVPVVRTVVGWYKYKDISGDGSDARNFIWETQPTYSLSFGIRDGSEGKFSEWYHDTQGGVFFGDGPVVDDGLWHHVVMVWNSVLGHVKYYHDGQLVETAPMDTDNNPTLNQAGFNIGTNRAADGGRNWDGYLDEIAIFSVELTEEQILGLYEQSGTINPLNVLE
ncbi:MAG: discoidin domain-containing protein, partial [Phycisphaeraceae bacterium]|nr:discoidin domain-containing protein [Phycisphaeraceae bacterium]